jgi:hypothetical protein
MNSIDPVPNLPELEALPIRMIFPHEAQQFTRWLRDNLDRLSAEIGIPLRAIEANAVTDTQIADLLARDERDNSMVVIENQLERSNYSHLGQTLTYAAAVDARSVVWVNTRFEAPHLATMRWLNQQTGTGVRFFAVEVGVVRIGASPPAVIFTVLERPSRDGRAVTTTGAPIPVGDFAAAFWSSHLARHPDEAKLSRPVGERCRWRPTCVRGVVIGQAVQPHGATVFLRGRYGVPIEDVERTLAPFADRLEQRFGVRLRGDRRSPLAEATLAINVADPANWAQISDWLRARADDYDAALRDIAAAAEARMANPGERTARTTRRRRVEQG